MWRRVNKSSGQVIENRKRPRETERERETGAVRGKRQGEYLSMSRHQPVKPDNDARCWSSLPSGWLFSMSFYPTILSYSIYKHIHVYLLVSKNAM